MALIYRIDPDTRIVVVTGDYADADEWRVLLTAVSQDPRYHRGFSFLRDVRDSPNPVSAETVIGIIGVVREFWDRLGVHRAAIVSRRGVDHPAVIAHALAHDQRIPLRAFPSYDEAVAWLQEGHQ
jgi:hypothetical protein